MITSIALLVALLSAAVSAAAADFLIDVDGTLAEDWSLLPAGSAISGTMTGNASDFDAQPRRLAVTIGGETFVLALDPSEVTGDGLVAGFRNNTDIFVTDPDVPGDVFFVYA